MGGVVLVVVGAAAAWWLLRDSEGLRTRARRHWATAAIDEIQAKARNTAWLQEGVADLVEASSKPGAGPETWVSDRLVVMRNAEWILYRNCCSKETPHVADLFIARGSDRKWYYSTFHFCVDMCELAALHAEQPTNLAAFVTRYALREFDGQPDQCLERTWFPGTP